MLSKQIQCLSTSMTIAITTLANDLKAKGEDIISFSAGEPDFDTPQVIKDAAIKAINDGKTKYTAVAGILELREEIAKKLKRDNNLIYDPNQIIVSNGAKQSLFNLFATVIHKGDEVIIPSPYWVTYPEIVNFFGGKSVHIKTDEKSSYKITPKQLENAITPKTKLLVLTTPSNPTGSVYSEEELKQIAQILKGTDILVASDEMYEKLVYDIPFRAVASISEDMFERTVTINGLSKSVAMTGWRMGYLATPKSELISSMIKLQSQSTSNINTITQYASIPALNGSADKDIESMRREFQKRRDLAVREFEECDKLSVIKPDGAFYLFVNIQKISNNSLKFCEDLLKDKGVAVIPGIGFGSEGHFRFSFASSEENIKEGIKRIIEFCEKY